MRVTLSLLCAVVVACTTTAVSDGPLPWSDPAAVGMSAQRLEQIPHAMQRYVDEGSVSGIVTMVARRGRLVHWDAVGFRDVESQVALERNDIFRICSMSKPVTSVAVMMLVEEGALALDDPVSRALPAFEHIKVYKDGELVDPSQPITIRDMLGHTSGLTYGLFGTTHVDSLYRAANVLSGDLESLVEKVTALPLLAHPGSMWNYSLSTDVLGRVIEVTSGQALDEFLAARIFEPLGMRDTAFFVPPEKTVRFTTTYTALPDGSLRAGFGGCGTYDAKPALLSGGGGLVSTAADYVRFAQMLLDEGELQGVSLLRPETVDVMRTNRLPNSLIPIRLGPMWEAPGYGFGLGFSVLTDADATPYGDNVGVFRWWGYGSTYFWIDPVDELIGLVMTQLLPPTVADLEPEFQALVYAALEP